MKDHVSIMHATANEDGLEQLTLDYRLGLIQLIMRMIKERTYKVSNTKTEEWIFVDGDWRGKYSWQLASIEKHDEIICAKHLLLRATRNLDT